jgi:hypothetical protein
MLGRALQLRAPRDLSSELSELLTAGRQAE